MKRFIKGIAVITCVFLSISTRGQAPDVQKYFVYFCNKEQQLFDPYVYFNVKSIERRIRAGLALYTSSDLPVNESYIHAIKPEVTSISIVSRWLNGAVVFATAAQIEKVRHFSFVTKVQPLQHPKALLADYSSYKESDLQDTILLKFQTERMQGTVFQENHIDGTGIRIAIFDAGFPGVDDHAAFDHIRKNGRIKGTYDFVKKMDFVYAHNSHGAKVLSCIAGKYKGIDMGLATGAEFLLARTEHASFEPFSEEENWLAAAEWADKNGADIINSSLGYSFHRYFTSDMNGHKSLVARAAGIAASKGILVVNAAGNEGKSEWKFIITPADGDSVLAVGGIDPYTDVHISFSSFGPTADKRLKPNVCAMGNVMAVSRKGLSNASGTSFATPLVAGFAACAWQLNRELSNMQLFKALEQSGHLYPYFDYAHGYGIPQAEYFISKEKKIITPTFDFIDTEDFVGVHIKDGFLTLEILPVDVTRNMYYTIKNGNGEIREYYVLLAFQKKILNLRKSDYEPDDILTVHYEGYTHSTNFK